MAELGYTFLGRYEYLDRKTFPREANWRISDALRFTKASSAICLGSSVGINEALVAAQFPQVRFLCSDIDSESIKVARSGQWPIDAIRPSGVKLSKEDWQVYRLYSKYFPKSMFEWNPDKNVLNQKRGLSNISFFVGDARNLPLPPESVDMAIGYVVGIKMGGLDYIKMGEEIGRVVKDGGYYWCADGLFQIRKREGVQFHQAWNGKTKSVDEFSTPKQNLGFELSDIAQILWQKWENQGLKKDEIVKKLRLDR